MFAESALQVISSVFEFEKSDNISYAFFSMSISFTSIDFFFNCLNISNYNEIPAEWGSKEQILRRTSKLLVELIGFDYE